MAFGGGVTAPMSAKLIESEGIDDLVGAVSVHGYCGVLGLLFAGMFLGGYPQFSPDIPAVTFMGQFKGAIVMILLGFIPGFALAWVLKRVGILRASDAIQAAGMDVEVEAVAYPEDIKSI